MILVLGKSGQLARRLGEKLGQYGFCAGREQVDFSKPESVSNRLSSLFTEIESRGQKIHAVINAAAYTQVDKAEDFPDEARAVNALSPAIAAGFAFERGIPFVHISSDYVYGRDDDQWIGEDSACNPQGVYARTKLEGDLAVLKAHPQAIILRTSWVWDSDGENFPNKIKRALKERAAAIGRGETVQPLKVVNDQWGRPTPAADLADACLKILGLRTKHPEIQGQIFHYTSKGEPLTWCGWAFGIQKKLGPLGEKVPHVTEVPIIPVASDAFPVKAKRPKNSRLSLNKIEKYGF